jgi:hypothetical protein
MMVEKSRGKKGTGLIPALEMTVPGAVLASPCWVTSTDATGKTTASFIGQPFNQAKTGCTLEQYSFHFSADSDTHESES